MAVSFGPNCRRKPGEAHAPELPGRMWTSPEVFFNAVSPSQSWQSLEHAQGMGTVPETHVTVQSSDELKEGPEDPWREAGCWKAGGRDGMVNDQLYGGYGSTFTLLVSQRRESSETQKKHNVLASSHLFSTLSLPLREETCFRAELVRMDSEITNGANV